MSDQNQWPKPGETPERSSNDPASEQSDASGQPQQSGASDPWAQSGQGTSAQGATGGYTAPGNPYAAPGQPGGQSGYGAPQNPYAAPQDPYGQQSGSNPYAAPQDQYGQQSGSNPYAAPQNPYGQQGGNPYGASGSYAAPGPYAAGGYQPYAQRPRTNTLAVLSIVFGLGAVPFFFIAILLGPAGAILGHIALGKIRQSGEAGRGLALTGIIAGWVMAGFWILWIIGLVVLGAVGSSYSEYDSGAFVGLIG